MMERDRERRKDDIIIQLGFEETKVGTNFDKLPRKSIKSYGIFDQQDLTPSWEAKLEEFLHKIFFFEMYYSPNDKTVVLLETIYMNRKILSIIAKLLFKKFGVSRIEFSLSSVSPLYCTSQYSGIVIHAGYKSTDILGVYQSYPLIHQVQSVPVGYETVNKNFKQMLLANLPEVKAENIKAELLYEMRMNYSSIPPKQQPISVSVDKVKLKVQPKWIDYNCYFKDPEQQEPNIAYSFLKMLNSQVDIDIIKTICKNIVLAGDLWNVRGFQNLFKKKIMQFLQGKQFSRLKRLGVQKIIAFAKLPFNHSVLAWVGSTVASTISNIEYLTLKRNEYENQGFHEKIFQRFLVDDI